MSLQCSMDEQGTYSTRSQDVVLSCPWAPRLTVVLSVSQSLWTDAGDGNTFATATLSVIGWQEELQLLPPL